MFLSYVLSFVFLGIYWNNHHHMLHLTDAVTGGILWANLHLLFWLSLVPFVTGWMGENHFAPLPTAVYGVVLLMAAIAYTILQHGDHPRTGPHSKLRRAVGGDVKGKMSAVLYVRGDSARVRHPWIADAIYVVGRADVAGAGPADRGAGKRDTRWLTLVIGRTILCGFGPAIGVFHTVPLKARWSDG